jgi:hypothetical protein
MTQPSHGSTGAREWPEVTIHRTLRGELLLPGDARCAERPETETYLPASQLDQVREKRDLAIAHDRQPYPTAEAYEKVCAARTKWQHRADKLQARVEELEGERDTGDLTVHLSGRTAVGLRYTLPLVATALEDADEGGDTTAMLEDAVGALDLALPPEFRGAIDDAQMAEWRMDVIDLQREAGVRPLATSPPDGEEPEPTIESRSDDADHPATSGRDRASAKHLPQCPSESGTEGSPGAGADPAPARSRAGRLDGLNAPAQPAPEASQDCGGGAVIPERPKLMDADSPRAA